MLRSLFFVFAFVVGLGSARAAAPTFTNLSQDDYDKIGREFSANTTFHSVTPASAMGSVFGFELGVTAGATKTPDSEAIAKRTDPNVSMGTIPHAGLLAAVTVPFGFTGELLLVPSIDTGDFKFAQTGLAAKWTISDVLLPISPVNVAVRGFYTKQSLSFKQTVATIEDEVKYEGDVTGLQVLVSPKLIPFIEPYIGVGTLKANSKMSTSKLPIFAFGNGTSAETAPTSTQLLIGADLRLFLIGFGIEYSRQFGTDSITGKFSLKF